MAEGTGKVAFVRNILSYFMYIAALGIGGYGMRECAKVRGDRDRLSRLTTELLTINMISTVIAYFAFAAFFSCTEASRLYGFVCGYVPGHPAPDLGDGMALPGDGGVYIYHGALHPFQVHGGGIDILSGKGCGGCGMVWGRNHIYRIRVKSAEFLSREEIY